jgi:hypothetical protein
MPLAIEVGSSYLGKTINPVNEIMFESTSSNIFY